MDAPDCEGCKEHEEIDKRSWCKYEGIFSDHTACIKKKAFEFYLNEKTKGESFVRK